LDFLVALFSWSFYDGGSFYNVISTALRCLSHTTFAPSDSETNLTGIIAEPLYSRAALSSMTSFPLTVAM
jgi:hypothetical protein